MDINAVLKVGFEQYKSGLINNDCLQSYFAGALNAFLTIGVDKSELLKALSDYENIPTIARLIKPSAVQETNADGVRYTFAYYKVQYGHARDHIDTEGLEDVVLNSFNKSLFIKLRKYVYDLGGCECLTFKATYWTDRTYIGEMDSHEKDGGWIWDNKKLKTVGIDNICISNSVYRVYKAK